jgi:hypothetical protein
MKIGSDVKIALVILFLWSLGFVAVWSFFYGAGVLDQRSDENWKEKEEAGRQMTD